MNENPKWRHPALRFHLWLAPKIRGSKKHPLVMADIQRLWRYLDLIERHQYKKYLKALIANGLVEPASLQEVTE